MASALIMPTLIFGLGMCKYITMLWYYYNTASLKRNLTRVRVDLSPNETVGIVCALVSLVDLSHTVHSLFYFEILVLN